MQKQLSSNTHTFLELSRKIGLSKDFIINKITENNEPNIINIKRKTTATNISIGNIIYH
jgi:hypothetical protein